MLQALQRHDARNLRAETETLSFRLPDIAQAMALFIETMLQPDRAASQNVRQASESDTDVNGGDSQERLEPQHVPQERRQVYGVSRPEPVLKIVVCNESVKPYS